MRSQYVYDENVALVDRDTVDERTFGKALGRPLRGSGYVLHHHSLTQFVLCQDAAYHDLLHYRENIYLFGGNPNTDGICPHCTRPFPIEGTNHRTAPPTLVSPLRRSMGE